MKIRDILNTYDILCENELYETLSSDFTFGFELEGTCSEPRTAHDSLPGYHSGAQPSGCYATLFNNLNDTLGFGEGKIESDSSLGARGSSWTFEYGSPVIPYSPKNIKQVEKFLDSLESLNVQTNNTCGFHTHFFYNGMNKENAAWLMCCMAIDDDMLNELKSLTYNRDDNSGEDNINFISTQYANTNVFENIKYYIENDNIGGISNILSSDYAHKYSLIRVHPQGTLEWRGPRQFLNEYDKNAIHGYLMKLSRVIGKMCKMIDAKTWSNGDNITIDKKDINKRVKITGDFNTPEERRKELKNASARTLWNRYSFDLFKTMKEKSITNFIHNNDIVYIIINSISSWRQDNNKLKLSLLPAEKQKAIINAIYNNIENYSSSSFHSFLKAYFESSEFAETHLKIENVLSDAVMKEFIKEYVYHYCEETRYDVNEAIIGMLKYNRKYVIDSILSSLYSNGDRTPEYFYERVNSLYQGLISKGYIKQDEIFTNDFYKFILNKPKLWAIFRYIPDIPVSVQRKLVRKNIYNVQYLDKVDPQIVSYLKKKNPNIEDYIPGVLE